MSSEINRLLMEMERSMRLINRETIGPEFPTLTVDSLKPVQKMVSRARANYLRLLFELADKVGNEMPTPKQTLELKTLRLTYEEVLTGAKALEIAISRGYLEVTQKTK